MKGTSEAVGCLLSWEWQGEACSSAGCREDHHIFFIGQCTAQLCALHFHSLFSTAKLVGEWKAREKAGN